jgi:hypothetical protein
VSSDAMTLARFIFGFDDITSRPCPAMRTSPPAQPSTV